jgi:predicted MFS family arabinose efflux permease
LLWAGQSVSMAGDGIFTVAVALEALRLDHSPTGLSLVLAVRIGCAVCLLPLGGAMVDRLPRRLAMVTGDAGRGIAVGLIALAVASGSARLWELIAMAVAFGIGDAIFSPASTAIVPELLPTDLLVQGSSLTATSKQAAQGFIGPAAGGLLVAVAGTGGAFAADAASFAVSAACLLAMKRRRGPATQDATAASSPRRSLFAEARDGLRYCASRRWLWMAVASHGFVGMIAILPLFVLVPLLIEQVYGQSGAVLGFVIAAGGVGGVIGAVVAGRLRVRRRVTAMWLSLGAVGPMVVALAAGSNAWYAGAFFAAVWAFTTYANVLWAPIMQEQVPPDMLGRASSLEWVASFAGTPVGLIGAGLLATAAGVRTTLLAGGALAALTALGLLVPGVRDPERTRPEAAGASDGTRSSALT